VLTKCGEKFALDLKAHRDEWNADHSKRLDSSIQESNEALAQSTVWSF
jgi:hypothetical protein